MYEWSPCSGAKVASNIVTGLSGWHDHNKRPSVLNDPTWQNPYLDNLFSLQIERVDIVMLLVSDAE